LGLRENIQSVETITESGVYQKVKTIVTPGGSFVEILDVIRQLRHIANYFGTGQRKQRLEMIQESMLYQKDCHKLMV
jgi:hypothetical protein